MQAFPIDATAGSRKEGREIQTGQVCKSTEPAGGDQGQVYEQYRTVMTSKVL
jgi:hypothetical protein